MSYGVVDIRLKARTTTPEPCTTCRHKYAGLTMHDTHDTWICQRAPLTSSYDVVTGEMRHTWPTCRDERRSIVQSESGTTFYVAGTCGPSGRYHMPIPVRMTVDETVRTQPTQRRHLLIRRAWNWLRGRV